MSEHLSECPWSPHDCDEDLCERCDRGCYCNELRACEERVREDEQSNNFSPDIHWDGMAEAYQRGLDAAREAVAAMPLTGGWTTPDGVIEEIDKAKTVAAIDALRKEN